MSIALDVQPTSAPFGGAEFNLAGTRLLLFRPSERRRGFILSQSIDISLLQSEGISTCWASKHCHTQW